MGRQVHLAFALSFAVLITAIFWPALQRHAFRFTVVLLLLGLFCIYGTLWFYTSYSIAPSAAVAVWSGSSNVRYFTAAERRSRLCFAAAIGVLLGLAVCLRLSNSFLAVGFAAVLGIGLLVKPTVQKMIEGLVIAAASLIGVLPVLAANWLNAGSPFATTYGFNDADPPRLSLPALIEGLQYYFVEKRTSGLQVIAGALVCAAVYLYRRKSRFVGLQQASTVGLIGLIFSVLYMVLHWPHIDYYLFPAACFAAATGAFCIVKSGRETDERDWPKWCKVLTASAVLVLGGGLLAIRYSNGPLDKNFSALETPAIDQRTVVWADVRSGFFAYYMHRQGSVLPFIDPKIRQRLIEVIAQDGRPQLFVIDSQPMEQIVSDLRQHLPIEPYGKVFGQDAFILNANHAF